jgi:hypothetical protein
MKKLIVLSSIALSAMLLLSGCLVIGNRGTPGTSSGTLGQQLIDLKTAHSNGAITDAEYQSLKAKVLGNK